ncbi:MAG: hypothetical protein MUE53_05815 [Chitinophagales bacterium]|jgi:hypothetical protein|nr:hypothetical protein [Chitinophagales bacterium]
MTETSYFDEILKLLSLEEFKISDNTILMLAGIKAALLYFIRKVKAFLMKIIRIALMIAIAAIGFYLWNQNFLGVQNILA